MKREELPPDLDALENWRNMPQNKPSRQALPPVMGGGRWMTGLLFMLFLLLLFTWLVQNGQ